MTRSFRSEWIKLLRPGVLFSVIGPIVGFTVLATFLAFLVTRTESDGEGPGRHLFGDISDLAEAGGLVAGFLSAAQFIGIIALVVLAWNVASEYGLGTLRVLLSHEPRRIRQLTGKVAAVALLVLIAVAAAFLVSCGLAFVLAPMKDVSTSAWTTSDGLLNAGERLANVGLASLGWGAAGIALGVGLRSSAGAIGAGILWAMPGETLIGGAWDGAGEWLPGQVFSAFAQGGTADVSYLQSGLLLLVYSVTFLAIGLLVFARRDVTS